MSWYPYRYIGRFIAHIRVVLPTIVSFDEISLVCNGPKIIYNKSSFISSITYYIYIHHIIGKKLCICVVNLRRIRPRILHVIVRSKENSVMDSIVGRDIKLGVL